MNTATVSGREYGALPRRPVERTSEPGNMFEDCFQDHLSALTACANQKKPHDVPFDEKRDAAATFNPRCYDALTLDNAMTAIMTGHKKPNRKQQDFLEHFVRRLKVEWLEEQQGNVNSTPEEPLLDVVHGLPGTGKSAVIGWMRTLMEDGLGWEHGVQFICLAFQNAMAAQINGFTVHHWSGIPVRSDDGNTMGDRHKQSMKCGALRVIIIDEVQHMGK